MKEECVITQMRPSLCFRAIILTGIAFALSQTPNWFHQCLAARWRHIFCFVTVILFLVVMATAPGVSFFLNKQVLTFPLGRHTPCDPSVSLEQFDAQHRRCVFHLAPSKALRLPFASLRSAAAASAEARL
jgi:uncharacterized membrane protein